MHPIIQDTFLFKLLVPLTLTIFSHPPLPNPHLFQDKNSNQETHGINKKQEARSELTFVLVIVDFILNKIIYSEYIYFKNNNKYLF